MPKPLCRPVLLGGVLVLALGAGTSFAQNFPSKPIRIVTTGPGSSGDVVSRLIGQAIAGPLGQPVVIEGRPVGIIPGQIVSQSAPDGHTLLYSSSSLWLGPLLRKSTPYDPVRDFQPIIYVVRQPGLLVVNLAIPAKSVKELVALAKARPGELNYATGATGSLTHLAAELLNLMGGVEVRRVDYKTGALAFSDLIAGRVQVMFGLTSLLLPQVKAGKLRALAVTSLQPTGLAPGVPALSESLSGFESLSNGGMFAPAKTPAAIVTRLNGEIERALAGQELKDKFFAGGAEPMGGTPDHFASVIRAEMQATARLVKERGIRIDD